MNSLKALGKILLGILRELSDEGPYQRHLKSHGREHSPHEWRHFCEHRLRIKYSRPKCC
jgi:hypothetical protein